MVKSKDRFEKQEDFDVGKSHSNQWFRSLDEFFLLSAPVGQYVYIQTFIFQHVYIPTCLYPNMSIFQHVYIYMFMFQHVYIFKHVYVPTLFNQF